MMTPILRRHEELPISNEDDSRTKGSFLLDRCLPGVLKRVGVIVVVLVVLIVSSR
jgi:hypothetical protein